MKRVGLGSMAICLLLAGWSHADTEPRLVAGATPQQEFGVEQVRVHEDSVLRELEARGATEQAGLQLEIVARKAELERSRLADLAVRCRIEGREEEARRAEAELSRLSEQDAASSREASPSPLSFEEKAARGELGHKAADAAQPEAPATVQEGGAK